MCNTGGGKGGSRQDNSTLNQYFLPRRANQVSSKPAHGQNGLPLTVLAQFKTDFPNKLENQIHRRFASHRLTGEWFRLSAEDLETIRQLVKEQEMITRSTRTVKELEALPVFALAQEFNFLPEEELLKLAQDIHINGLRSPILIWEGQLLDGRNRLKALLKTDLVQVPVEIFEGTEYEAASMIFSANVLRRHDDASVRAMVALKLIPYERDEAARRQEDSRAKAGEQVGQVVASDATTYEARQEANKKVGKVRDIVAEKASVSPRYIQMAQTLAACAPDLAEQVRAGELKLTQATNQLKARQEEPENRAKEYREAKEGGHATLLAHRQKTIANNAQDQIVKAKALIRTAAHLVEDFHEDNQVAVDLDRQSWVLGFLDSLLNEIDQFKDTLQSIPLTSDHPLGTPAERRTLMNLAEDGDEEAIQAIKSIGDSNNNV